MRKRFAPGSLVTWFDHNMDSRWHHGMVLWSTKLPRDVCCKLCCIMTCHTLFMLIELGGVDRVTVCDSMIVCERMRGAR